MHEHASDPFWLDEGAADHKLMIYQLFVRLFSNTNTTNRPWGTITENGVGKFNEITFEVLCKLKDFGYTHIWYTGILEHATMTTYADYGIPVDDPRLVKGRAGSPYAVKDYFDVDPDLAVDVSNRMGEWQDLLHRTHQAGLKALIDFIPNHLSRQYFSDQQPPGVPPFGKNDDPGQAFAAQNNFYYLPGTALELPNDWNATYPGHAQPEALGTFREQPARVTGNDVFHHQPGVHDWYESIKLNYGVDYQNGGQTHFDPVPDTWHKMLTVLRFWAEQGVDGFRCDMAEMVPVAFWAWVIPQLKDRFPNLLFIAEIYNEQRYRAYLEEGCFDYLYDKVQLYDTLRKLIKQEGNTDWLTGIWQNLRGINHRMLRFLENHDEQRIASPFFASDPWHALPGMMVAATWQSGPVMLYFGQEVGEPGVGYAGFSTDDGRTTIFDYWGCPLHQQWYNNGACDGQLLPENNQQLRAYYLELFQLCRERVAIRKGHFYDLQVHHRQQHAYSQQVLSYLRFTPEECLLFVINFSVTAYQSCAISLPSALMDHLALPPGFRLEGIFGTTNEYTYEEGVSLELPPLASFVLLCKS